MPLFLQTREKENMGTLPLMALLPRVRPILVATPWVLVPKRVQVHRPLVTGHPTTGPLTTGQSSNGQEDISGQPGLSGHLACPVTSHRAFAGQTGDVETSSLPITGHRPSSHRSLELERLNSAEIQESPITGDDRSPGS